MTNLDKLFEMLTELFKAHSAVLEKLEPDQRCVAETAMATLILIEMRELLGRPSFIAQTGLLVDMMLAAKEKYVTAPTQPGANA